MGKYTVLKCPHCGKVIYRERSMPELEDQYGSPVRTCPDCRKTYLDNRYVELACQEKSYGPPVMNEFLLILTFSAIGLFLLLFLKFYIPGGIAILFALLGVLSIKDKKKKFHERYQKYYTESENRLKNMEYAIFLHKNGYYVPDKYLPPDMQEYGNDIVEEEIPTEMLDNEYYSVYKSFGRTELESILDNADEYGDDAIKAVKFLYDMKFVNPKNPIKTSKKPVKSSAGVHADEDNQTGINANIKPEEKVNVGVPNTLGSISVPDEIRKYKSLLDEGIITEEEFILKKKQLLNL